MLQIHSKIIKLFADSYIAQLVLGFSLAFALQGTLSRTTNLEEYSSADVRFAIDYALIIAQEKYPVLDYLSNNKYIQNNERLDDINIHEKNEIFQSIDEAVNFYLPIRVTPVFSIEKKDIDFMPDEQVLVLAEKMQQKNLLKINEIQDIKSMNIDSLRALTLKEIENINEKYRPKQYQLKEVAVEYLNRHKIFRIIDIILLVIFLIIQPWNLYSALKEISLLQINSNKIWVLNSKKRKVLLRLLSIGSIIGVILTYSTITWGKAYSGTIFNGLLLLLFFWTLFDASRICELFINNSLEKNKGFNVFISRCKLFINQNKSNVVWFGIDILLLFIVIYLYQIYSTTINSYKQLESLRQYEIIFMLMLVIINILYIGFELKKEIVNFDGLDKYINSLGKLSILSNEDETDSEAVTDEIEKTIVDKKWLDIGSGNLQKVKSIIDRLSKKNIHFTAIDCLEPRELWINYYPNQLPPCVRKHNQLWPNFIKGIYKNDSWSIITLIHSLYQSEIINDLITDLIDIKSKVLPGGCVIIVTEGDKSSLLTVKKNVYKDLGGTLVTQEMIIKTTQALNWPTPIIKEYDQKFYITRNDIVNPEDDKTAYPWFIFESFTSSCDNIPINILQKSCKLLIKEIQTEPSGRTYLNVQDVVLIYRF